uniref:Uncharacterized protein n=1 Tax=Steinernema glaseri TaxID=37863 RepID=A0A1I7ZEB6_9BILA
MTIHIESALSPWCHSVRVVHATLDLSPSPRSLEPSQSVLIESRVELMGARSVPRLEEGGFGGVCLAATRSASIQLRR